MYFKTCRIRKSIAHYNNAILRKIVSLLTYYMTQISTRYIKQTRLTKHDRHRHSSHIEKASTFRRRIEQSNMDPA